MDAINKLAERFADFPGIGPRQSKRFVYYLLSRNGSYLDEFARLLTDLKRAAARCVSCRRFFVGNANPARECPTCADRSRDASTLMIVEKEVDFENIERTGVYRGYYFILGGTLPVLEKEPNKRIHGDDLRTLVRTRAEKNGLKEIIFALSATTEGDFTKNYLETILQETAEAYRIKRSMLGRGLSTGLELEYSDIETLRNALDNRK